MPPPGFVSRTVHAIAESLYRLSHRGPLVSKTMVFKWPLKENGSDDALWTGDTCVNAVASVATLLLSVMLGNCSTITKYSDTSANE
jgi:hypothetical protein